MTDDTQTPPGNPTPVTRLLIVDDEPLHLQALGDVLGEQGYAVDLAADAREALELLRRGPYDLLLTDLDMPGLNGLALLREAAMLDPLLVSVMMTGKASVSSAVEAMQAGAIDYIVKPFKLATALPVLKRAVEIGVLRRRRNELEERVAHQMEELRQANRDLESFARSVSHDLRAPLHVIAGFTSLVLQRHAGQLDPTALHFLERVRAAAGQMGQLIDGLLSLSRLGRQALHIVDVDVAAMAREVAAMADDSGARHGAEITVSPALPVVQADPVLLRQVIFNLVSNACKFSSRSDSPKVWIECDADASPVVFRVRDNGAGFEASQARELFEPFHRLHSADDFPGIGLGLSIVHRIVTRHGGRVWAESSPGEGATFHFTLAAPAQPVKADRQAG